MLNPDLNDYQLTSIITECCGGVAVVYSATYKPSNQNVAIKRYFVDKSKEKASLIQVLCLPTVPQMFTYRQDNRLKKDLQHREKLTHKSLIRFGSSILELQCYKHNLKNQKLCFLFLKLFEKRNLSCFFITYLNLYFNTVQAPFPRVWSF